MITLLRKFHSKYLGIKINMIMVMVMVRQKSFCTKCMSSCDPFNYLMGKINNEILQNILESESN